MATAHRRNYLTKSLTAFTQFPRLELRRTEIAFSLVATLLTKRQFRSTLKPSPTSATCYCNLHLSFILPNTIDNIAICEVRQKENQKNTNNCDSNLSESGFFNRKSRYIFFF